MYGPSKNHLINTAAFDIQPQGTADDLYKMFRARALALLENFKLTKVSLQTQIFFVQYRPTKSSDL